jgi:hypothetical protein
MLKDNESMKCMVYKKDKTNNHTRVGGAAGTLLDILLVDYMVVGWLVK